MRVTGTSDGGQRVEQEIRNLGQGVSGRFGVSWRGDKRGKLSEVGVFDSITEVSAEGGTSFEVVGGSLDVSTLERCEELGCVEREGDRLTFRGIMYADIDNQEELLEVETADGEEAVFEGVVVRSVREPR